MFYQRAQEEWPWIGVIAFWYFKPASDEASDQAWYYFRMVEPDFTPLPVYDSMREYTSEEPVMYPGWHQEDHWAINYPLPAYNAGWERVEAEGAAFGTCLQAVGGRMPVRFTFDGARLDIVISTGPDEGELSYEIDGSQRGTIGLRAPEPGITRLKLADLPAGRHHITLYVPDGACLDGFIVMREGLIGQTAIILGGAASLVGAALVMIALRRRAAF